MKKYIRNSLFAAFVMAILFSFCAIPASAAEIETDSAPAVVSVTADMTAGSAAAQILMPMPCAATISPASPFILAAAGGGTGGGAASGSNTADTAYQSVINFFLVWIRRVGALVALIGGIMFGLSVKNNDSEQKQAGILTMVAGFIVFAIALGADMFDLFT
jgi:hypothetical protein